MQPAPEGTGASAHLSNKTTSERAGLLGGHYNTRLDTISAVWTINDQQRLLALDALHDRMLSYHNNIHVKESKLDRSQSTNSLLADGSDGLQGTTVIAQAVKFSSSGGDRPHPLSYAQLMGYVRQMPNPAGNDFTWLHLRDPTVMDVIASELGIHDLIAAGFQDYRAHSSMLPGNSEMLLSMVTSVLESNDCNMYKLFVYVSSFAIITFQVELLPDLTNIGMPNPDLIVEPLMNSFLKLQDKCQVLGPIYLVYELALRVLRMSDSSLEFISCALSYFNRIVHLNLLHRERLELRIKMDMIASSVLLMKRSVDEVRGLCNTLLQLSMEQEAPAKMNVASNNNVVNTYASGSSGGSGGDSPALTNSNNVDANVSYSSSLLFNNTRFNPNATTYMKKYTKYNLNAVDHNSFFSQSSLRSILYGDLVHIKHIPYLLDLCDAYTFIHTCLHTEFEETVRLQAELDGTIQLRTSNTSLVLSLIATIFLPLTFLASVFGMNFAENGGYTIGMLNYKYGPMIFSLMCACKPPLPSCSPPPFLLCLTPAAVCFVCIFVFFVYQGWIEIGVFARIYRNFHMTDHQQIDDSAKTVNNPRAIRRADDEELRRKEASMHSRRSVSMSARAYTSMMNRPSVPGASFSSSGVGSSITPNRVTVQVPPSTAPVRASDSTVSTLHGIEEGDEQEHF